MSIWDIYTINCCRGLKSEAAALEESDGRRSERWRLCYDWLTSRLFMRNHCDSQCCSPTIRWISNSHMTNCSIWHCLSAEDPEGDLDTVSVTSLKPFVFGYLEPEVPVGASQSQKHYWVGLILSSHVPLRIRLHPLHHQLHPKHTTTENSHGR